MNFRVEVVEHHVCIKDITSIDIRMVLYPDKNKASIEQVKAEIYTLDVEILGITSTSEIKENTGSVIEK